MATCGLPRGLLSLVFDIISLCLLFESVLYAYTSDLRSMFCALYGAVGNIGILLTWMKSNVSIAPATCVLATRFISNAPIEAGALM